MRKKPLIYCTEEGSLIQGSEIELLGLFALLVNSLNEHIQTGLLRESFEVGLKDIEELSYEIDEEEIDHLEKLVGSLKNIVKENR